MRCSVYDPCSKKSSDYFWFHDGNGLCDRVFGICHDHSQVIFGKLIESEYGTKSLINVLSQKMKRLERENASVVATENTSRRHEIIILAEKRKRMSEHLKNIRNNTCRLCNFPLKEPQKPDRQIGSCFSHADLHSEYGKRRETILFHTICGRIWMDATFGLNLRKMADRQHAILEFV